MAVSTGAPTPRKSRRRPVIDLYHGAIERLANEASAKALDYATGPEVLTTAEFAQQWGVSRATALRRLDLLAEHQKVEAVQTMRPSRGGGHRPVPAWRILGLASGVA